MQVLDALNEGLKVMKDLPEAYVKTHVFKMNMGKLLEEFQLDVIADSLNLTSTTLGEPSGEQLGLSLVPEDKRDDHQTQWFLRALCDALRAENKLDVVATFINKALKLKRDPALPHIVNHTVFVFWPVVAIPALGFANLDFKIHAI